MANGWTPERRACQVGLMRTWRLWERSTGPRTAEGKAASPRNAYKGATRNLVREMARLLKRQRDLIQ